MAAEHKFTERTRRVMDLSVGIAGSLGYTAVNDSHIILGIIDEGANLGFKTLGALTDITNLRQRFVDATPRIANTQEGSQIDGLDIKGKQVVELAADEAKIMNNNYIGTEHLLVGVLRRGLPVVDGGNNILGISIAAFILKESGVNLEAARREIHGLLNKPMVDPLSTLLFDWQKFLSNPSLTIEEQQRYTAKLAKMLKKVQAGRLAQTPT